MLTTFFLVIVVVSGVQEKLGLETFTCPLKLEKVRKLGIFLKRKKKSLLKVKKLALARSMLKHGRSQRMNIEQCLKLFREFYDVM